MGLEGVDGGMSNIRGGSRRAKNSNFVRDQMGGLMSDIRGGSSPDSNLKISKCQISKIPGLHIGVSAQAGKQKIWS